MAAMAAAAKDGPTYYTPERLAVARENLARYEWAQATFERLKAGDGFRYYIGPEYGPAETYAEQSDEFMWLLQPTTKIARFIEQEARAICPVHGTRGRDLDPWCPYNIDPIEHPYKIQCMLGGEWYPSNDYASGDLTSGEYPDDGNGCRIDGCTYFFLREYVHMAYGSAVIPALRSLSQAYALTGDARYGRKGTILLARLASEYPNHDDRQDRRFYALYNGRDPRRQWITGGMITDHIWETFCLEGAVYAYDGLYPYMGQDPDMLAFLRDQGMPVESADDLRRYIEHYLVRAGMIGLLNGAIKGNEGHHQAAALACALVLDDYTGPSPNSVDLVDYAFHGVGHAAHLLVNGLTRDGGGHESPSYSRIELDLIRVDRAMSAIRQQQPDLFPLDRYPDLFGEPKARLIFDWFLDMTLLDAYLPSIGDTGGITDGPGGTPGITELRRATSQCYSLLTSENLYAFQRYGDPRMARAATRLDGTLYEGELFEPYPADQIAAALQRPESHLDRGSRLLDGYGVAILSSGDQEHRRAAMLNYSSLTGHRQRDHLSLGLFARGVDWLPDLGYPHSWDHRWQWDANSLAHNTVTVDETQPRHDFGGAGRLFARADGIHVICAGHDPYPPERVEPARNGARPTRLYERLFVLVDVDEESFYLVDVFTVDGGEQHDQSWHGPLVPVQPPELDWIIQDAGTLAGPDVEPFGSWTDRWGRDRKDFPSYLTGIRRATLARPTTWTWPTDLPEGDGLRLHLVPVGGPLEAIGGRGRSPARPEDWGLDYILARRQVTDGSPSVFVSVVDAYQGDPVVREVRLLEESPVILEVERAGATDRLHLHLPLSPSTTPAHRPVGVRVRTQADGETTRDVRIGQWAPDEGGYVTARIAAVDCQANRVAVPMSQPLARTVQVGRTLRIYNESRTALYRVIDTDQEGDLIWMSLNDSALLARGQVVAVEDSRLQLDSYLTFARRRPVTDGELIPGPDYYAGAWLTQETGQFQVVGAVQDGENENERNTIYLQEPVDARKLRALEHQSVSIWQYGVGDQLELALIEA
jgi:oligo-alginate lyase